MPHRQKAVKSLASVQLAAVHTGKMLTGFYLTDHITRHLADVY